MRLPATLSLLFVAIATVRAEAPPVQGTMPEDLMPGLAPLLKTAVERSPSTLAANIAVAVAEANRYLNAAALFPQLNFSSDYAVTRESLSQGSPSTSKGIFYSANLSQNLFQWGAVKNQAQISRIGEQVAGRRFADAYRQVAVTIREQYMALIEKKIALRNVRFSQKIAEENLAAADVKFQSGSSSEAELGGYKLALEEAKLATDRSAEDFEYAKQVFIRLVGVDGLSDDSIPLEVAHSDFKPTLADAVVTGFVGGGVESTFQSEVYQMTVKQDDLTYKIAKVRQLPKVLGLASYSYSNYNSISSTSISQLGVTQESYEILATWDLFDGFATRGSKLSALAQRRSDELQKKNYTDASIDSITTMRRQLGFTSRAMVLAETHDALIEAEIKRLGDDKALGYASQASIDSGILTLDATQFNMSAARADFLSRWTEFISLAGIDPADDNIPSRYVR
jgi:outer membrane protein TolC